MRFTETFGSSVFFLTKIEWLSQMTLSISIQSKAPPDAALSKGINTILCN